MNRLKFGYLLLFSVLIHTAYSQPEISPSPYFSYGKGLGITSPDSLFMLNIRFRMQNRLALVSKTDTDLEISRVEARTRRLRLRLDGFIYTPKLSYLIQLAFTRADMDFDDTGFPNIIRDAMIIYKVNSHFSVGMGQTKLPGNRQRVNSSGDLQFADRSIVNSTFNVDRDLVSRYTIIIPSIACYMSCAERFPLAMAEILFRPTVDLRILEG